MAAIQVRPSAQCPRAFRMTLLQRADQRPERHVPPPAVRQPAARPHPGRHLEEQRRARQRQRARAELRPRRQRPVLRGEHHGFAQLAGGVPALPGHDLVQRRAAAQRGGQHAARARPDEEVDVGGGEPLVQADQRAGHPGRAEHAARAEHQADPGTARPITRSGPKTTAGTSASATHPHQVMGLPKGNFRRRGNALKIQLSGRPYRPAWCERAPVTSPQRESWRYRCRSATLYEWGIKDRGRRPTGSWWLS